jgi:hypothetical protein
MPERTMETAPQKSQSTSSKSSSVEARGKIREGLWKFGPGSADVRRLPTAFVICLCGRCGYEQLAEVVAYIGRHWDPERQELVLDFTNVGVADPSGVRFLTQQLMKAASQGGTVSMVHAPLEARACYEDTWGQHRVHFVQDLAETLPPSSTSADGEGRSLSRSAVRAAGNAFFPV